MKISEAYNQWSINYDTTFNKTRDLEAIANKTILSPLKFSTVLELGCGTGKNTQWLSEIARHIFAVDFSTEMLAKAKLKIRSGNIQFAVADITAPWDFIQIPVDLITCSLILEHISDLDFVFNQAHKVLNPGGYFYIGELHPFKQYLGSKAKFEQQDGTFELECHTHHFADYFEAAQKNNFICTTVKEWFDEVNGTPVPRILSLLFQKP